MKSQKYFAQLISSNIHVSQKPKLSTAEFEMVNTVYKHESNKITFKCECYHFITSVNNKDSNMST